MKRLLVLMTALFVLRYLVPGCEDRSEQEALPRVGPSEVSGGESPAQLEQPEGKLSVVDASDQNTRELFRHMEALIAIQKKHLSDCDKLVSELDAYGKRHGAEISETLRRGDELEARLSEQEKEKLKAEVERKMEPLMTEAAKILEAVSRTCPERIGDLDAAMKRLTE